MKLTIRSNPEIVIEVESITEERKVEPTIVVPDAKFAPDVKPEREEGKIEKKRGKGIRHCKKCGKAGHRSDNCSNGMGGTIAENIQNLKDEGLTSDEIADRLGLSLPSLINTGNAASKLHDQN